MKSFLLVEVEAGSVDVTVEAGSVVVVVDVEADCVVVANAVAGEGVSFKSCLP